MREKGPNNYRHNLKDKTVSMIITHKGKDYEVLIDKESFERVKSYRWLLTAKGYVRRSDKNLLLHRVLLENGLAPGLFVDHVSGDKLDNRMQNLRVVTNQQNAFNQKGQKGAMSRYKGVYFKRDANRKKAVAAKIKIDGKPKYLGHYYTEKEAARAYDEAAKELYGEYARLNFL